MLCFNGHALRIDCSTQQFFQNPKIAPIRTALVLPKLVYQADRQTDSTLANVSRPPLVMALMV